MNAKEIARIKKALTGAEGRRLDKLNEAISGPPLELRNAESRRAAAKLASSLLKGSATQKEFAAILDKDQAGLDAALKKAKDAAIKGSRAAQAVLSGEAQRRTEALGLLAALPVEAAKPRYNLLNKPLFIWPTNTIELEADEVIPAKSFVKFRGRADRRHFRGNVKFYYLWNNPDNTFAVINVDGYIIFHGHGYVGVGGGTFAGDRQASLGVTGSLEILEWENQPPTQPIAQPDQSVKALSLSVEARGMFEVGAIDSKTVFRGYDLRHTLLVVPPLATLVFTVTAEVAGGGGKDSGLAEFDFASGAFQIGSPAVLVTILS